MVAAALHNLALIKRAQGNLEDAEKLCLEALAMRRKLQGAESPEIAASLDNLALISAQPETATGGRIPQHPRRGCP